MTRAFNESIVEDAALTCFEELGYGIGHSHRLHVAIPFLATLRDTLLHRLLSGKPRIADEVAQFNGGRL